MYKLEVKNLNKSFLKYPSTGDYLRSMLFSVDRSIKIPIIKNLSFSVRPGETFGILGTNGSGKSTVIRMIANQTPIDSGTIHAHGKLLKFNYMTGFIDSYSGFDNIYYKCSLLGLSREKINQIVEEIMHFSELGDDIYKEYRSYSSSMKAKLGFSIAINIDVDIIVLDGSLAVGDDKFRRKCHKAIYEKLREGVSIIFATHSQVAIENLCQRCLWIDDGEVICVGNPKKIATLYKKYIDGEEKLEDIKYGLKVGRYGIH